MNTVSLPKPVNVSPLIRFARWSMLIYGIYYGINGKIYYRKLANKRREDSKARKEAYILAKKVQNLESSRVGVLDLANNLGISLPPEWNKPCFGEPCEEAVETK